MPSKQKNSRRPKAESSQQSTAIKVLFALIALIVILSMVVSAFIQY